MTVLLLRLRQFLRFSRSHTTNTWQLDLIRINTLGTAVTFGLLALILVGARILADNLFASITWPYVTAAFIASGALYLLGRKKSGGFGGVLLILIYSGLGTAMMCRVGLGAGAALLFSLAVILASAVYGFWLALVATELITATAIWFRAVELQGGIHPVYVFAPVPHNFDTVVAIIFMIHAMLIACSIVHHYLVQASRRVQAAEAERIRQLYRLAEIGEISTALMHDMANKLSSLGFELDNMQPQATGRTVARAKKKVKQLNQALDTARQQMKGRRSRERFDVAQEVTQVVAGLQMVAEAADVTLRWKPPRSAVPYSGEKILFQQAVTILIKNAIDSYPKARRAMTQERSAHITLTSTKTSIVLTVADTGRGIQARHREHIFEPFYSTKKDGMGMGLYLTKRFIEDIFGGTINLETVGQKTIFAVTLPKRRAGNNSPNRGK